MKKITSLFISVILSLSVFSQGILFNPNQAIIKKSIENSIVIIEQQYLLKSNTGNLYGYRGQDFYGRIFTIGFIGDNKVWTFKDVYKPWDLDSLYREVADIDSLEPVLGKTYIRHLYDTSFTLIPSASLLTTGDYYQKLNRLNLAAYEFDDSCGADMLRGYKGPNAWVLYLYPKTNTRITENTQFNFLIYKINYTIPLNLGQIEIRPPTLYNDKIIGGFLVKDTIINCKLNFKMVGLVWHDKHNKWYVSLIPKQQNQSQVAKVSNYSLAKVKLVDKTGQTLRNLCSIVIENTSTGEKKEVCTNSNGIIEVIVPNNQKILVYINNKPAICLSSGGDYIIKNKYSRREGKYYPKKVIKLKNCR